MVGAGRLGLQLHAVIVVRETRLPTGEAGDFVPAEGAKSREGGVARETNRRVGADILRDTSSVAHLAVEFVLVDAVRAGRFTDVAGAAGEHQLIGGTILLGIKQVGAKKNVSALTRGQSKWPSTYHSRQKRKWIWSACLVSPPAEGEGLADILDGKNGFQKCWQEFGVGAKIEGGWKAKVLRIEGEKVGREREITEIWRWGLHYLHFPPQFMMSNNQSNKAKGQRLFTFTPPLKFTMVRHPFSF